MHNYDEEQMDKWIESLHESHDSTANIMVDQQEPDSLAHNILHATLIQVVVQLYHRVQDLEKVVVTLGEEIESLEKVNEHRNPQ